MIVRSIAAGLAGLTVALASAASAADLMEPPRYVAPAAVYTPELLYAVSSVNGKIELSGGYEWGDKNFRDHALGRLSGALSFPIGQQFGGQIDVTGVTSRGEFGGSLAGHGFWRNPTVGLLGVYAETTTGDVPRSRLNYGRVGGEGELYLDRVRLSGIAGVEYGNHINQHLFVDTLASFYLDDNIRLYGGYRYNFAGSQGRAGVEYQLPAQTGWGNVALFGEGRFGQHGYAAALAGVKVYFGNQKSLYRRHREDDPEVWSSQNFADAGQAVSGGRFAKHEKKKCDNPPPKGKGGCNDKPVD